MPIKSFRGQLTNNEIRKIFLHTNTGSTGYRINKMQIFTAKPGIGDVDHVVQVFTVNQTAASADVDFENQTLLGAAFLREDADATNITARMSDIAVFDNVTFNQDIYITLKNARNNAKDCNFYIELEQVKIDLTENTVATLKDIRNIVAQ